MLKVKVIWGVSLKRNWYISNSLTIIPSYNPKDQRHLEQKVCRRAMGVEMGGEATSVLWPAWLVLEAKRKDTNVSLPRQPPLQVTSELWHCLDYSWQQWHCLTTAVLDKWGFQGQRLSFTCGEKWNRLWFRVSSLILTRSWVYVGWLEDGFTLSTVKAALEIGNNKDIKVIV